jgi:hypothetical protein
MGISIPTAHRNCTTTTRHQGPWITLQNRVERGDNNTLLIYFVFINECYDFEDLRIGVFSAITI